MNDVLIRNAYWSCKQHDDHGSNQATQLLGKSNLRPAGVMVVLVKLTEDPLPGMASTVQT